MSPRTSWIQPKSVMTTGKHAARPDIMGKHHGKTDGERDHSDEQEQWRIVNHRGRDRLAKDSLAQNHRQ